jgi:hypothetical protein
LAHLKSAPVFSLRVTLERGKGIDLSRRARVRKVLSHVCSECKHAVVAHAEVTNGSIVMIAAEERANDRVSRKMDATGLLDLVHRDVLE